MKTLGFFAAAAMIGFVSPASASVTVGNDSANNCFPFSCSNAPTQYQQVYSASAFSAPLTITSFTLFEDEVANGGTVDSGTYAIKFYLTSAPANGLSSDFASNRGALLADFGIFNLSGALLPETTFDGMDFAYNPFAGNLLLDVLRTASSDNGSGFAQFSADSSGTVTSRNFGGGTDSLGLVTRFNEAGVSGAVPEPSTWAMMLLGFGAIGFGMRRRKENRSSQRVRLTYT